MMKRWVAGILCLMLAGLCISCSTQEEEGFSLDGVVVENYETSLLVGESGNGGNLYSVSIGGAEIIDKSGKRIDPGAIGEGSLVRIYFDGTVAESFPAQIFSTTKITVLGEGDSSDLENGRNALEEMMAFFASTPIPRADMEIPEIEIEPLSPLGN